MSSRGRGRRLVVAVLVLAAALPVLRFTGRTLAASWLVFPPPLLNPIPPSDDLAVLAKAAEYAPGDATYSFLVAQLLEQRFRGTWFDEDAPAYGRQAAEAAERAVQLLPANPYYHRLAGSIALDRASHPSASPEQAQARASAALRSMQQALSNSPYSPLLHQQVGVELSRAWQLIGDEGRRLALTSLRRAAALETSRLRSILENTWARNPSPSGDIELDAVTPETAPARLMLAVFLEERAQLQMVIDQERGGALQALALAEYRRAVLLSDLDPDPLARWTAAHRRLAPDDVEAFVTAAQQLADLHPDRPEAWLAVADAAARAADPAEEMATVARAVELARERGRGAQSRALRRQADLFFERGLYEPALEDYRLLATIAPRDPHPFVRAGRCLDALGRSEEALASYEDAVRTAPRSAVTREALARAYLERHEYLEAIQEWRAVLALDRNAVGPRLRIARAYVSMGLPDQAMQAYSEALEISGNASSVRAEMDDLLRRIRGPGR